MTYWIVLSAILIFSLAALLDKKNKVQDAEKDNPIEEAPEILKVSVSEFNNHFGGWAGRYCEHCDAHGSHHTDRHNDYASVVLSHRNHQNNG